MINHKFNFITINERRVMIQSNCMMKITMRREYNHDVKNARISTTNLMPII